jgi:hypothetical protein
LVRYAHLFTPLFKSEGVSIKAVKTRRSPISYLLGPRCPSAVIRLIVAVIVNALNAHPVRRLTHISKEIVKAFPPITHGYASSSVVLKDVAVFVLASLAHPTPNIVSRSPRQTVPFGGAFCQKAAAGLGFASSDISAIALNNVAALAPKAPDSAATPPATYALNGCEPTKNHASHIKECHRCNSTTNKRCYGVWARQQKRHAACMALQ